MTDATAHQFQHEDTLPLPEPPPDITDARSPFLAGRVRFAWQFQIERLADEYLIWQELDDGRVRYATLEWHEHDRSAMLAGPTLALSRRQATWLHEDLLEILQRTPSFNEAREEMAKLRQRVALLEAENALLRDNLGDLRVFLPRNGG